jgi:LppP/LprE lipoprotein
MRRYPYALLALALIAGCTGRSAKADPAPRQAPAWVVRTSAAPPAAGPFDYAAAMTLIRRQGFTVDDPKSAPPGPFRALHAVGTGSADGAYQKVFFFADSRLVGSTPAALIDIVEQNGQTVRLRLPQYASSDPQCCPSGKPHFHTAQLDGGALRFTPPLPANLNN